MVQTDPEASERPSAQAKHQLWFVEEWETSLTPPPLLYFPSVSPVSRHLTSLWSNRGHRCFRKQAGPCRVVLYYCVLFLDDLRRFFCCPVRSEHRVQLERLNQVSPPPPSPVLPEEWEECRGGRAETRVFEWTKGQKVRVLPPKWRKILGQEQHVSLLSPVYLNLSCLKNCTIWYMSFITF